MPLLVLSASSESEKNTYLGLLTFAGLVLAIVVQPVAGYISDNSNFSWGKRRPYILGGAIISSIIIVCFGFARSILALLIFYCVLQVSSNTSQGPWQGLIPDTVEQKKRGTASGVKGLMEIIGAIAGIEVAGYFLSGRSTGNYSSRLFITLGILALFTIVTMLVTIFGVKEKASTTSSRLTARSIATNTFKINVTASSDFIYYIVSRFLFLMPLLVLRTFGLYLLKDYTGLTDPVAAASDLTVVVGVSVLVMVYPSGHLADKIGRRPIVIVSGLISTIGFVLLLFAHSYIFVLVAGSLIGLANGAFMSSNWAMATDLVKKGEEARYLGLTNFATGGATAVAALIGPGIDFLNRVFTSPTGYEAILIFCALLCLVSSLLVLRIRSR